MSKFKPARFSDFSWGINLRNSADRIDDNQFQELINMSSEGNKLIVIKWYQSTITLTTPWYILLETWVDKILTETWDKLITEGDITFV